VVTFNLCPKQKLTNPLHAQTGFIQSETTEKLQSNKIPLEDQTKIKKYHENSLGE
jgi:hypothetical protein